ncbi:MAG: hypothetical protein LBD20_09475 [Spirochaetaceae bacterium]|jgi:hypothetical protein|nr:hypothetical protein [Spirochaetaceae bacterium]
MEQTLKASATEILVYVDNVYIEAVAKLQFSTANIPGKCFGSLQADKTRDGCKTPISFATGSIIKNMHKEIGITSPYVNFRDALFHYRKMYTEYKNNREKQVVKQSACISEHLNRGIKDFIVYICSSCFMSGIDELPQIAVLTPDRVRFLAEIRSRLCDIILEIRLSGLSLTHFDDTENKQWYSDFITTTTDFYSFLSDNNLLDIYKRIVQKSQLDYDE